MSSRAYGAWIRLALIAAQPPHGRLPFPAPYSHLCTHPTPLSLSAQTFSHLASFSFVIDTQSDYSRGHHERLPYDDSSMRSIYHVRDFEVYRLMQVRYRCSTLYCRYCSSAAVPLCLLLLCCLEAAGAALTGWPCFTIRP